MAVEAPDTLGQRESTNQLTRDEHLFLLTGMKKNWDQWDFPEDVLLRIDFSRDLVRNTLWLQDKFITPWSITELINWWKIEVAEIHDLEYWWLSQITSSDWRVFVCLLDDIVDWQVDPLNIFVLKSDIKNRRKYPFIEIEKWTPITKIKSWDVKVRWNKPTESLSYYAITAWFSDETGHLIAQEDICKVSHYFTWKAPEYKTKL